MPGWRGPSNLHATILPGVQALFSAASHPGLPDNALQPRCNRYAIHTSSPNRQPGEQMVSRMMIALVLLPLVGLRASAQGLPGPEGIDLSGSWVGRKFTDAIGTSFGTGGGPTPVEYQGIPLNDSGRAYSLTYSQSQLSMPERMCAMNAPTYIAIGPMTLRIWPEFDMLTGSTTAWIIGVGASEDTVPIRIWMDGRPHPSNLAPHDKSGFTTG